jgi:DNA (cytosine-5)-methyltransferase 1
VQAAAQRLHADLKKNWVWWNVEAPGGVVPRLETVVDIGLSESALAVDVDRLLSIMDAVNRTKVDRAIASGAVQLGTVYKRGRPDADGVVRQRAEVRFDGIAGCLRTPAGGSSRQTIVVVRDGTVSARLLSAREAARLMGLPETYRLPEAYNEAYKLSGDGVAVPVVRFLRDQLFHPILSPERSRMAA